MDPPAEQDLAGSTAQRVRGVLAIPAFRRLWGVTAITAVAEWQSLLALSALATQLTTGYQAQSFALGGVVATKLLPAMLLGPLAGALADKLDRRHVMVVCDVLRAGLFLSIPLVGQLAWLFAATFLIELCALFWIPAKDASIPNLLRRPEQVETANQLSLIMTYGVAVLLASGVFSALSKLGPVLRQSGLIHSAEGSAYLALSINGFAYAFCALVVGTRIPEISGRALARREAQPGLLTMLRDGVIFVRGTPLVRGLVTGILGAFAAGGAVIACAKLYSTSLGGGDAAYGLLFASLFVGLGLGMAIAPLAARRIRHRGLFGLAIVAAGLALVAVALAPHLIAALAAVILVGCAGGVAFLTGLTIIGAQVADEMRGRTIAFVQSLVRLDLLASMALVPFAVGLVQQRTVTLFSERVTIDGTRPVLLCAGLLAAMVGVVAHRQMDDRQDGSLLADLRSGVRKRLPASPPPGPAARANPPAPPARANPPAPPGPE
jgi:dTMP kinase